MKNSFVLFSFILISITVSAQKIDLAPVEMVQVKESNVLWQANLDTGSVHTIINASSIAVMNASFPKEKNVTKQISFKLKNADGAGRTVNSTVSGVVDWNGQKHYTVLLEIGVDLRTRWEYRKVNCVLADLSENEHKLILGQNWLGDDIHVK